MGNCYQIVTAVLVSASLAGCLSPGSARYAYFDGKRQQRTTSEVDSRSDMATAMDQAAALRVTEQAADQGDARAMANLGYMKAYARTIHLSTAAFHRMDGTTMARENADEVKYYRQAANAGDALGQTNLGVVCLLDTDRTTGACDDTSEAAELFRRASENGFPRATVFLAYMTEQGLGGLQKDIGEADLLYRRAYEQGDILGGVFREEMYNCKPLCDP